MKVAVLGSGSVGSAIGRRLQAAVDRVALSTSK